MFPFKAVASVTSIGGMAGSLGGVLSPTYSGKLLDQFKAVGNVTGSYAVLFGVCAGAYLVAFLINHICAPRFDPIQIDE